MPELIPLTNGGFAMVDSEDVEAVSSLKWRRQVSGKSCYAVSKGGVLMHRLILRPPKGMQVDHVNGIGLNNTRKNIRICTPAENARNRRFFGNKAGVKGVVCIPLLNGGYSWAASITHQGVHRFLGTFSSKSQAAQAYREAAKKLHAEFARVA